MFYVANPAPYPPALSPLEVVYVVYMLISIVFMIFMFLEVAGFGQKVDELIKLLKEKGEQ